jgi:MFS family permease
MDKKVLLSTLWLFATLNYLYCDVLTLMHSEILKQYMTGKVNGMQINQGFLLGASILMEIPVAMVLLSRVLKNRANRWASIVAGAMMTIVQFLALVATPPTPSGVFFSIIEIASTALIVWFAWNWRNPED